MHRFQELAPEVVGQMKHMSQNLQERIFGYLKTGTRRMQYWIPLLLPACLSRKSAHQRRRLHQELQHREHRLALSCQTAGSQQNQSHSITRNRVLARLWLRFMTDSMIVVSC